MLDTVLVLQAPQRLKQKNPCLPQGTEWTQIRSCPLEIIPEYGVQEGIKRRRKKDNKRNIKVGGECQR